MFSDSDDEGDQNVQLTINEHYAKAFEYRKEREELEKLEGEYGPDINESDLDESTDSESAESEDEDGEELTPAVDAAILRTLARIRKKDPAIYDSEKNIFGEEKEKVSTVATPLAKKKAKDRSKPVTLRQVAIDAVLHPSRGSTPEPRPPTHMEEQEALRNETIKAFRSAVAEDDDDPLLIPREKAVDDFEVEGEQYKAYLERHVGEDLKDIINIERGADDDEGSHGGDKEAEQVGEQIQDKKKRKKKKVVDKKPKKTKAELDQEFLMSYILNRGWVDNSSYRVPTYQEITGEIKKTKGKEKGKERAKELSDDDQKDDNGGAIDTGLLSDASFESLVDVFETSYNHRFEEPGADTIKSFPRHIETTIRRADPTRKEARERRKERKEAELTKQKEEVKRMKTLKMKEIKRKLEKIGMESGLIKGKGHAQIVKRDDLEHALQDLDLEGEWNAEKHDQQLRDLFPEGEDGEEALQYDSDGKPIWTDDIDLGDIAIPYDDAVPVEKSKKDLKRDRKERKKKKKMGDEDEQGAVDVDAMDADRMGEGDGDDEEWDGTEEMRKRKLKEYMDSIYDLDFNDLVGDMPTRFKYVPVSKQTYSLDPVEILLATDQELNEYMSVKKYAPYRQDKGDRSRWDPRQQEKLKTLKENLNQRQGGLTRPGGSGGSKDTGDGASEKKKRKGRKERMKMKASEDGAALAVGSVAVAEELPAKKRKRDNDDSDDKGTPAAHDGEPSATEETKRKKRRRRQSHRDNVTV